MTARGILIIALLMGAARGASANQDVYPALTRETLVSTWEGVFGVGMIPVVFHIVIAPRNEDSYLSEIYPDSMQGRLYRLHVCRITDGQVYLALPSASGRRWE